MSDTINENKFVFGVLETIEIKDSDDLGVLGRLQGTIRKDDKICITNYGDDDDELVVSSVARVEADKKIVESATDCLCALIIRDGLSENIKPGSVIHSEDAGKEDIHRAYIGSLGDSYVGNRDLELYETELNKMSITDCAEAWRIFVKVHEKKEGEFTIEEINEFKRKISILSHNLAKKILAADEIYCVVNRKTGEPHMFSRTTKSGNDFICAPPEIQIFSKPCLELAKKYFSEEVFEIRAISNGENKDGIRDYLFDAFYLNGAVGMRINYEVVGMSRETIIPKPNYMGLKEVDIPVTNPDLVRWMLLRSQMNTPTTDAEKIIARLYYRFFAIEMLKAKFLIPSKVVGEVPEEELPDNIPEELMKDGEKPAITKVNFPILVGKNRKNMVFLFTDIKRLRTMYNEDWTVFAQPIDKFIYNFDVYINFSNKNQIGCSLNKGVYEEIRKMLGLEEEMLKAEEKLKEEDPEGYQKLLDRAKANSEENNEDNKEDNK